MSIDLRNIIKGEYLYVSGYTRLDYYLMTTFDITPVQYIKVFNVPYAYIVLFNTINCNPNKKRIKFVLKSKLNTTKITFSPLGIETYFWVDDKLVCSILERNGQGWFIRTPHNCMGEYCTSQEDAENKAIEMCRDAAIYCC